MKKMAIFGLTFLLIFSVFSACSKKPSIPKAGSATADDMLTLLPKNAGGVLVVDVHRAMTTDFAQKMIKENKEYQKYQEIINEIGVDPQKDVFFVAVGVSGEMKQNAGSAVGVVNLKYNKDKLLAAIKKQDMKLEEKTYEGITLFSSPSEGEGEKRVFGAFLDESNILIGPEKEVQAVVDIVKKKAESIVKNKDMMALVKTVNRKAMLWSVFLLPPEQMKSMAESTPFLSSLQFVKSLSFYLDYKNKGLEAEIKAVGTDEKKNKDVADFLNGLKGLGGLTGSQKPELGELLNKIEITSAADFVKIYANIPQDLLEKLSQEAQKQVESKLAGEKEKQVEKQEETKKPEEIKK
jgi:hypothetical protein